MKNLHSYCDHTEAHVLQVAFLSMYSLNVLNQGVANGNSSNGLYGTAATELDYKTMFVAGLVHDLGMAAGEFDDKGNPVNPAVNSYLEIVDGKPVLKSKVINQSTEDLADTIRGNHTLNSALAVLNNRALFESIGVDPDLVALLCFSHSKSNSGVSSLVSSADWAFSIEKIVDAVNTYNHNIGFQTGNIISFNSSVFGSWDGSKVETSPQKVKDAPKNKYEAIAVKFSNNILSRLANFGISLRVGDAYVNKAKIKLPEGKEVTWSYNGKNYSSRTLVLTQSGVYMAFDSSAAQYYDIRDNTADTESSMFGAFIYLKPDGNGGFVPWSPVEGIEFKTDENGSFVIDESNNSCLLSSMGVSKAEFKLSDRSRVKYVILDNGYFSDGNKNNPKYYKIDVRYSLYYKY